MILNGADVNGTDNERPLIAAAGNGHGQCVQLLLQHGAEVNISNSRGQTALLAASQSLFMYVVEILLDAGAKPSMDACYQIHEALRHHGGIDQLPLSCIKKLVNALSLSGMPLVELSKVAFERARLDLVKYLLDKESDSTVKDHYSFALHYAVEYDWIDVVRHLLDRGVEINSLWNSETALCCACRYGHSNIVQLLLQRGADPYLHGSCENDFYRYRLLA
jgi:ankyrin repeat protein